jgi:hypothetical protein
MDTGMKYLIRTLLGLLAFTYVMPASAQVFLKYGPAVGIQKNDGTTYQDTAAVSTDVTTLFGCTTPGQFLNQAGGCTVPAGTGVTSVAVPAPLTATGCSGGACVLSWTTGQTANRILATPDATTGAVSLRAMVAGDVPPINLGSTANGGVSSATILLGTNGGTSNGFFSVTGPTTALRTFTFPNASATILTTNAVVTVPQGGTGLATLTANGVLLGEGTSNISPLVMGADTVLRGTASADPVAAAVPNCGSPATALSYSTSTHAFGCQTISVTGTPGGSTTQMQYNNAGALGGAAGLTWDNVNNKLNLAVASAGADYFNLSSTNVAFLGMSLSVSTGHTFAIRASSGGFFLSDGTAGTNPISFDNTGNISLVAPAITNNSVTMTPRQGTFTMTYNGFSAGNSLTATYYAIGNQVTLIIPGSAVQTSNATTFTATGIPATIQPAQAQQLGMYTALCEDNSVIGGFTCAANISGGTITFAKNGSNSGWTASNQKGITTNLTVTYLLN